ncbi:hypothetical protein [Brachybacterium sp. FME24]|uniref:LppM family (lipo)protein n=1 Tax=Brachybacterium sp. FME24 TaxID=2742605 RepID=UPI001865AE43|nr:hypothetical protein [Brachybacterium sp. FME24]
MNTISARRRLYAVLVLPLILILAGCGRLYADYEINDIDSMNLSMDFGVDSTYIESEYSSAEELCTEMEDEGDTFGEVEITAYDEDGIWGCRASGAMERSDFGDGMELTEEDGEFHLTLDFGSDQITQEDIELLYGDQAGDFDFRMSFAFPGKVLESKGGTVDGKTVTYTDISEVSQGVDITAKSGGFPWLIVIIIVVVLGFFLLLALAAVAFFVIRARRSKGSGTGGPGGMHAAAAFGAAGASSTASGNAPPAAPQGGQQNGQMWGQTPPPAAPQGEQGQQWGQAPPAAPQGGQNWGQASPPPAAPQGEPWGQASPPPAPQGDQGQQWGQPGDGQPGNGQPGDDQQNPQGWSQPPQNPGW